jgi:CDP-diacylglycerol---serine O-phosphatidyltransferase
MSIYRSIPNALTLLNLFLGCLAIVYLFYDHLIIQAFAEGYSEQGIFDGRAVDLRYQYGMMHIAAFLLIAAVLLDFLDGFAARLFNAASELGKQLDSLADLVTFGLVPGLMLYYLLGISYFGQAIALKLQIWLFLPAFIFTLAAAYRLARYNITSAERGFRGLPVPAAALFVAGLPLALLRNEAGLNDTIMQPWVLYGITGLLAWLMASRLPMLDLKFSTDNPSENKKRYIIIGGALILALAGFLGFGLLALLLPLVILWYVLCSLILKPSNT